MITAKTRAESHETRSGKLIYATVRTTVATEEETGYTINALIDNFFPPIPDKHKLVAA